MPTTIETTAAASSIQQGRGRRARAWILGGLAGAAVGVALVVTQFDAMPVPQSHLRWVYGWPVAHLTKEVTLSSTLSGRTFKPDRYQRLWSGLGVNIVTIVLLSLATLVGVYRLVVNMRWPLQIRLATIFLWTLIVSELLGVWCSLDAIGQGTFQLGLIPTFGIRPDKPWVLPAVLVSLTCLFYVVSGAIFAWGRRFIRLRLKSMTPN